MIVPVNQDGKHDVPEEFAAQAAEVAGEHAGTRQGKDAVAKPKTVLVDLREFRCSLPSMLHLRGMKVVPVHLEIGDYILSPDMCVERKSISDLFGSFNTGRLYSQAEAMSRAYATPVLLIEWAATATFSLQNQDDLTDAIQINSISSKLVLLTLHFPNLRLLWSRSPAYSAEIIEMLKETQCEPNLDTIKTSAGATMEGATLEAQEMLSLMPGVTSSNIYRVLDSGQSLQQLCDLSQAELGVLLQSTANAKALYEFLHATIRQ
eukprot:TRINITY_DN715_c0_g1_i11.p1 TRINITY_DN715_c0_g1~~TRINITY_DN715_c0_g1_i11.p1  ORF type:complete len:263 (-),score=68.01 TRINITY_DN715_c0_g1_i11:64-852(-)